LTNKKATTRTLQMSIQLVKPGERESSLPPRAFRREADGKVTSVEGERCSRNPAMVRPTGPGTSFQWQKTWSGSTS
jgi:hypothetical protein